MATAKETNETKETKETKAPVRPGEELVTVRLFKDSGKYKDDVFVCVNGERIKIQRGVPVQIKKKFADVLENSMEQDQKTSMMILDLEKKGKAAAEKLGI